MLEHQYSVYAPPPEVFERGEGARLFDAKGDAYLDFIAGIAVNALGYSHPKLVAALKDQADKVWHLSNMFAVPARDELAAAYCDATFAEKVFFTNSGTEAIECALKTARKHHFVNGRPERIKVVTMTGAFHGRSYAAINAGGNPSYLEGFGPAMPGFEQIPFGDFDALKAAVDETTAAVLFEPVQGEGGVRALDEAMLRDIRALCDERGALVIYDEVQCGAGRTGKLFAYQWADGAEPDIMAVAKGVGGGFPLGACLATEAASDGMRVGSHGSTYGGNPLAMAVGLAVWKELTAPGFLDRVNDVANHLRQGLHGLADAHADIVEEVRGKGLLLGLKLKTGADNKAVRDAARAKRLLIGVAGDNVVRFAPPLIITSEDASEALSVVDAALAEVKSKTGAPA
ncbi:MAG: aspartate aminotransferase family protein [Maricaulaceae bacterium]|jgi:acetylornithine/N-succinyldiaminopimelate aminotransferase